MPFKPNAPMSIADTALETWFERDRAHVALRRKSNDTTIIEWWDDAFHEAVSDGFLTTDGFIMGRLVNDRPLHEAAFKYAGSRGLL